MCFFESNGYAHDADKAFFTVQQKDHIVEVEAELPWSIRNALFVAFPELENSRSQVEFDTAFFKYIRNNFQIKQNDSILKLISVEEATHEGHSHQNNFKFLFEGNSFDFVKNMMMFNLNKGQENYHDILVEANHIKYITSFDSPSFQINSSSETKFWNTAQLGLLMAVIAVLGLFFFFKLKK